MSTAWVLYIHQDTCSEVRDGFTSVLQQGLRSLKLPLSYLSIFALSGVEPRRDTRAMLRQFLGNHIEKRREWVKQHSKAKRKEHEVDCMLQLRQIPFPFLQRTN